MVIVTTPTPSNPSLRLVSQAGRVRSLSKAKRPIPWWSFKRSFGSEEQEQEGARNRLVRIFSVRNTVTDFGLASTNEARRQWGEGIRVYMSG